MQTTRTDLIVAIPDYEFTDAQNQLLTRLTGTMRIVGVTTTSLGLVLFGVGLWISALLFRGESVSLTVWIASAWPTGLPGLLFLTIGIATLRASRSFSAITRTRGQDMPLLMDALEALTQSYLTQVWFAAVGVILAGALVASSLRS